MPKKGQKYNKYSKEFILKVLKYLDKHTYEETAKEFNVPMGTLPLFVKKHGEEANILAYRKRGRKSEQIDYKAGYELLMEAKWLIWSPKPLKVMYLQERVIENKLSLKIMLEIIGLDRKYWDKYKNKDFTIDKDYEDYVLIKRVFEENNSALGYREITALLQHEGIKMNHKKVLRIMQNYDIQAVYVSKMLKKGQKTRINKQKKYEYEDLIKRNFKCIKERFTVLYTDITYLTFKGKRYYQCTIIDGYTKEIVAFKIGKKQTKELVLETLREAIAKIKTIKKDLNGIIIHSDHGRQYTSIAWKKECEAANLIISMGEAYTCADNVVIESFHATLKKHTIHNNRYKSIKEYVLDVYSWNHWYNKRQYRRFGLN